MSKCGQLHDEFDFSLLSFTAPKKAKDNSVTSQCRTTFNIVMKHRSVKDEDCVLCLFKVP